MIRDFLNNLILICGLFALVLVSAKLELNSNLQSSITSQISKKIMAKPVTKPINKEV